MNRVEVPGTKEDQKALISVTRKTELIKKNSILIKIPRVLFFGNWLSRRIFEECGKG